MADKNPFTALGFVPSVFKDLRDEDIKSLVKSQHRTLAVIHHPDRGGKPERFKEVQDAFDKLKEDFEFEFWKKMFLRNRKDQLAELEKAHAVTSKEIKEVQQSLISFWQAFCHGRALFFHELPLVFGKSMKEMEYIAGFSVFDPPPVSIIMMDRFEVAMVKQAAEDRELRPPPDAGRSFEFRISAEGVMTRQALVKTRFDPRYDPMPKVRKELIELRTSPISKSYYWKTEGEPEVLTGTLLGALPQKCFSNKEMWQDYPQIAGLIPADVSASDFKRMEHGHTLHEFGKYLRFIQPRVMSNHLVVFAEGHTDLKFKILGYVRKILPLEADLTATTK